MAIKRNTFRDIFVVSQQLKRLNLHWQFDNQVKTKV